MTEENEARQVSPAARRMRASRARRRARTRVVPFEVRDIEIDALINHQLLDPADRDRRRAIAAALGRLLDGMTPTCWRIATQPPDSR